MTDKDDDIPDSSSLFARLPDLQQMRDPLLNGWNQALGADSPAAELDLAQLIDFGQMSSIFQNFLEVIGLPVAIVDLTGRVLASSNWQRLCLEFHRTHERTLERCLESDTGLSRQMQTGKTYALYRCGNGLTDCAAPIVVEGRHIANLFIGQFLLATPDPAYFEAQRAQCGFDREAYFQALAEVPIVNEEKLPAILNLLTGLARQTATQSLAEHRARMAYATVEQQVAERTAQLQASYDLLHKLASQLPGVIYQFRLRPDGSSHLPYCSEAIADIFRLSPEVVATSAEPVFALIHPDDLPAVLDSIQDSADKLTVWKQRFRVRHGADDVRCLFGQATPQREADGSVLWHGFITDVSDEVQAEEQLRLAASVFSNSQEGILITDRDGIIVGVNPAFCHISGYTQAEILGCSPASFSAGQPDRALFDNIWHAVRETGMWHGEIWNRDKQGAVYPELLSISAVADATKRVTHHVAVYSDISHLKQHQVDLERIAHHDALTRLPNRLLLADRLRQAMVQCQRHGTSLAVVYLDLDGFKAVNDQHGHDVGDELLIALARRMKDTLREGDTLARMGGDEFVAVLIDLESPQDCTLVLSRLLQAAAAPAPIRQLTLRVSASIGVTAYPQDNVDAEHLLRHADHAMYSAKQAGKNRCHWFDEKQEREA